MSTPSLVQHGIIAYFLWRWKKDMNESDRQLQASKCRLGQPFKGEHQKPWGSSRSVWVREIRVMGLGTEGIWD